MENMFYVVQMIQHLSTDMNGFHVKYLFWFFVRRPNFLEAKNGSRQWENLENL